MQALQANEGASMNRDDFIERIAALAGQTTYRVPVGGRGTKLSHLPDAHAVATALSFARRNPEDIGPDIAYCWALGTDAYRERVTRRLSDALRHHRFRGAGSHRLAAVQWAWQAMIHGESHPRPAPHPPCWELMVLTALATLESEAWEALRNAENRYYASI